jgi:hypothetical protein
MDGPFETLTARLQSDEQVGIAVGIVLAILAAYASEAVLGTTTVALIALLALGFQVPLSLSNNDLLPGARPTLVALVAAASIASWALFLGTYLFVAPRFGGTAAAVGGYGVTLVAVETVARAWR